MLVLTLSSHGLSYFFLCSYGLQCYFDVGGTFRPDGDLKTYKQIRVDILRTNPTGFNPVFTSPVIQSLMCRVLLIWAIRNPASGYVQVS